MRCGCGAVAFIFSIYLKPVLYVPPITRHTCPNLSFCNITFFCFIPATFVCEDDLPNCEDIVKKTADMCEEHSDYAWVNCRKTCEVTGE